MKRALAMFFIAVAIAHASDADRLRLVFLMSTRMAPAHFDDEPPQAQFDPLTLAPIAAPLLTGAALAGIFVERRRILRRMRQATRRRGERVVRRMMA